MTTRQLHAWVLHKHWSGDTSLRVHLFTRELGLVTCLCKGGRVPKKHAYLQAFTPLWVEVNERHDRYFSKSVESIAPALSLEGHSLFSGLYVNELLYYTLKPIYPDPTLFDAYLNTLNGLAATQDSLSIEALLRRFEWTLLNTCGHGFSFMQEAHTGQVIEKNYSYVFLVGEGFVRAEKGIPGEHLLALARDDLSELHYLRSAKVIMRQAIDHLLGGREIKARALYQAFSFSSN